VGSISCATPRVVTSISPKVINEKGCSASPYSLSQSPTVALWCVKASASGEASLPSHGERRHQIERCSDEMKRFMTFLLFLGKECQQTLA